MFKNKAVKYATWRISFGDDIGLPNICDRNCAGCCDDFRSKSLKDIFPDKRQQLFKKSGINWFPSSWYFKEEWKENIINHFKKNKGFKIFQFTGRGDPLFYLPAMKAYMKVFKELKYKGRFSVSTSASILTYQMIDQLYNMGINEVNFNLAATNFNSSTLAKMMAVKEKINVSVGMPILSIYQNKLLKILPFLNNLKISRLTLAKAVMVSKTGEQKLRKTLPKNTIFKKVSPQLKFVKDDKMLNTIIKEIKDKKYTFQVFIEKPTWTY